MRARLGALYRYDTDERLIAVNQWDGGSVPRVHLAHTTTGVLLRARHDLPDDLVYALSQFAHSPQGREAVAAEGADPATYVDLLAAHAPVTHFVSGPAYRWPDAPAPDPRRPDIIDVTQRTAERLRAHMPDWLPDVGQRTPFKALLHEGEAVAVCASARMSPAVHEAGVETVAALRGRGFATSVVAAWAADVQRMGATPCYSTRWDNHASRAVAARLDLRLYGSDLQIY